MMRPQGRGWLRFARESPLETGDFGNRGQTWRSLVRFSDFSRHEIESRLVGIGHRFFGTPSFARRKVPVRLLFKAGAHPLK